MSKTKTPEREQFPVWSTDQQSGVTRYSPLPTPTEMKETSLFGIPLKSSMTGQELSDNAIQKYINDAISELEHELDMYILPVTFSERYDYDRHAFTWNYNYLKLNHGNVNHVSKVQLSFSNNIEDDEQSKVFVDFPLEHVHVMHQEGTVQLVPAFGTSLSGFLLSAFSGAQYHALRQAAINNFPGAMRIEYECGFKEGKSPALISALIERIAAYKLLSAMGPVLFPASSTSIGIDGTSQSVSTLGPNFLKTRLDDLEKMIHNEKEAVKGYYQRRWLVDFY